MWIGVPRPPGMPGSVARRRPIPPGTGVIHPTIVKVTPEQRRRAGAAVAARIAQLRATAAGTARSADIHPKTLRAIIRGDRWPTDTVQSQLERALRWHEGELAVHAVGARADGLLDAFSDAELARELARRLTDKA